MEKFFDKESLIDSMYTLKKEANIDEKDYRLWYKFNERYVRAYYVVQNQ